MVSKRLTFLFITALGLIYLHGLEEVLTGFPHVDPFMKFGANFFNTSSEGFYWISHIFLWWLPIPLIFLIFRKTTLILLLLALFGIVFFFEIHHLIKAFVAQSYYPGMITAFFYPILGVFFYKELLKNRKTL